MRVIGICRNPDEPFFWDAKRVGEPCPGCSADDDAFVHEFYVQVDPAAWLKKAEVVVGLVDLGYDEREAELMANVAEASAMLAEYRSSDDDG
jgi:hypothetical protein